MPIHVRANEGDCAKYCLLPGDPSRAEYIANKFFKNPQRYTDYRMMYGYTGYYKDVRVSVQATGMGCPSISIVVEELNQLGVKYMTRVGTCGGLQKDLNFADLIIATAAWGEREITKAITKSDDFSPVSTPELFLEHIQAAQKNSINYRLGPICSTSLFYQDAGANYPKLIDLGCLAVEMEAAALFALSAARRFHASCILTVSDLIHDFLNPRRASEDVILSGVDQMVEVALDSFVNIENNQQ